MSFFVEYFTGFGLFFSLDCRGISKIYLAMWLKRFLIYSLVLCIFLHLLSLFCCSFHCVCSIKHFLKCSNMLQLKSVNRVETKVYKLKRTQRIFGNWFVFIHVLRSKWLIWFTFWLVNEKDLFQIHHLFRLFFDSADIYSSFVFAQLMCSMLELACTTFQLNLVIFNLEIFKLSLINIPNLIFHFQQIKHPDYGIILLSQALMLGISMMFVYCYFGELANSSFENMTNALYESNWLNLPIKLQKYYIVMIGNAQQSLYYHGFHITILNLNTFAKVICDFETFLIAVF